MPPSEEIVLTVRTVVATARGIEEGAIARPVRKILGFARVGDDTRSPIKGTVAQMVTDRQLV